VRTALLALAFTLLGPALVQAHPIVLESSPSHDAVVNSSPEQVAFRFNSAIETRLTQVTMTGRDGRPIRLAVGPNHRNGFPRNRLVIPLPLLSTGTYVIRYKVLATDGHITEGALRFTVRGAK
jgi:methionine-rich copper-binding protein CopC